MKKMMAFLLTAVMVCSMGTTAFAATAKASSDKVAVNGQQVQMQAYNINGYNYFKLRDVAAVLNNTRNTFYVGWDERNQLITLDLGWPYDGSSDVGKPLVTGTKTATPGNGDVMVLDYGDEEILHLSAYNIDGYNYFKLRDLGNAVGFDVGWDEAQKCVNIQSYSDAPPAEMMQGVPGYGLPEEPAKPTVVNDTFYIDVDEGGGFWYDNYTFNGEVIVCWMQGGDNGRVKFTNCKFNRDLVVMGALNDEWVSLDNCTFAPGMDRYFAE